MMSVALGVFFVSATATAVELHGVAPADQIKYAGEGSSFKCLTDGAVFPLSVLNDDFCDCADGTDEPGTSACAGRRSSLFYCPNEGSAAVYLYASRVNDGICDCCDGSDEWLHGERACSNVCEAEGELLRRAHAIGEAERVKGNEQRRRLMDSAVVERQRVQQDLVVHRRDLIDLEAAEVSAAAALDVAKKVEALQSPATSQSLESEAAARVEAQAAPPTEPAVNSGGDEGAVGTDTGSAGAKVSEYAKWMEGSESSSGISNADTALKPNPSQSPKGKEEASSPRRRRRSNNPLWIIWSQATELVSGIKQKLMQSPADRAIERAKGAHDSALQRVSEKRRQIHEAERRLKEFSVDGNQLAYASLAGRCFTKKLTEYKYEVCFFKDAKQDSTHLGKWLRWESPGVALFTNGRRCNRGPPRSLRVIFRCGVSEEIEEVSEPSRCAYQATIAHPAACSDTPLSADAGPRLPTEEL